MLSKYIFPKLNKIFCSASHLRCEGPEAIGFTFLANAFCHMNKNDLSFQACLCSGQQSRGTSYLMFSCNVYECERCQNNASQPPPTPPPKKKKKEKIERQRSIILVLGTGRDLNVWLWMLLYFRHLTICNSQTMQPLGTLTLFMGCLGLFQKRKPSGGECTAVVAMLYILDRKRK